MKRDNPDIKIDESKHREVPGPMERAKLALYAMILAVVLVQVMYYYGFFKGYSLGPGSVFFAFDNPLFILFLGICGILGWFRGRTFTETLNKEISNWKFW